MPQDDDNCKTIKHQAHKGIRWHILAIRKVIVVLTKLLDGLTNATQKDWLSGGEPVGSDEPNR